MTEQETNTNKVHLRGGYWICKDNPIVKAENTSIILKKWAGEAFYIEFECKNNQEAVWEFEERKERDEVFNQIKEILIGGYDYTAEAFNEMKVDATTSPNISNNDMQWVHAINTNEMKADALKEQSGEILRKECPECLGFSRMEEDVSEACPRCEGKGYITTC